ncbi:MAG: Cell shape-determining protein MreB [Candidatus Giovannonibacteria bacterium GW2011_GWA2_44_13b]|uniref:Cell shape-determining protein MreB n=2 Tax=Candidatus Giovannoniibacteriota TaxID=1752738 RepID=A0A0G1H744_9BACT|nr:MAG: Cell shape-determining protein MreB [Candidatus Giovannonibacteria bacterium GW2011_GWA2_44_13b]OGF83236.1 MAG: rod shape-determining protein [Candidatus Giovannonibacteria bacterium RIFCSPLOWO2_01_FULL_44_16]
MFNKIFGAFSKDLGIDLGTANTLVYIRGEGIVINEPSVVALNKKTEQVVAIGTEARKMVGRTPAHIVAVRPLVDGVISDFEVTAEMLTYFIKKCHSASAQLFARPRIVIGIPSGITEVERRAVRDAAKSAGAREVYLVEEPMAAAIGVRLPVQDAVGNMVIDLGGGTTDIAVISLGGVVVAKSLRVAGDRFNEDIAAYARDEFKLVIGERTAEDVKIAIGSVWKTNETLEGTLRGRDLVTGLPREVIVTDADVRAALTKSVKTITDAVKATIEETPPELVSDIMHRGILMVGGGSMIRGLDKLIERETKMPVYMAEDPMTAVVRGTGIILEDIDSLRDVLIEDDYDIPPS